MTDKNFNEFMNILINRDDRHIAALKSLEGVLISLHVDIRPELNRSDMMQRIQAEQQILKEATAKAVKKDLLRDSNRSP